MRIYAVICFEKEKKKAKEKESKTFIQKSKTMLVDRELGDPRTNGRVTLIVFLFFLFV